MSHNNLSVDQILDKCVRCRYLVHGMSREEYLACGIHDKNHRGAMRSLLGLAKHNKIKDLQALCEGKPGMITLVDTINAISDRAWMSGRGLIGFSTGCLHQAGIDMLERLKIYLRAGALSVELSFATPSELMDFSMDDKLMSKLRKFSSISLHAPWKDIVYFDGSGRTDPVLKKISELHKLLHFSGVVFHPDLISAKALHRLEVVDFPVLIENMDSRKKFGITPEEIDMIAHNYDVGFVLDLQHAFEHDSSMKLACEMMEVMSSRLSHFHVSGCNENFIHAPVHLASNWRSICQSLRHMPSTPVILEGVLTGDNLKFMAAKEYLFVKENGNPIK